MDKTTGIRTMAVALAAVMMLGGFAMMATPVKAASYHGLWYADLVDGSVMRIINSADATDPNGGVTRFYKTSEATFVNADVNTAGGAPYTGMSDWIGPLGQSTTAYASFVQTTGAAGPTDVLANDPLVSMMELDKTKATAPRVYYSNGVQIGTVPNGYIWAGAHLATADADEEVFPGTAPATTFFQLTQMPAVTFATATTNTWSFPEHGAGIVGDTNNVIASWNLMEATANNGPWTEVGTAAYGATITYDRVDTRWYSVQVEYTGAVTSLVLSQPLQEPGGPVNTAPVAVDLNVSPATHNGNTVSEFVTIFANATDVNAADTITGYYRVDGAAYQAFGTPGVSPRTYNFVYNFPNGFATGVHNVNFYVNDGTVDSNVLADTFTITDTTNAIAAYTGATPLAGASLYAGSTAQVDVSYEDFTAYNAAQCILYYRVNATAWNNVALSNTSFAWGSYTNNLRATFPISGIGGTMDFYATVGDLGGGALVTLPTRTINVLANAGNVGDPFPVYGYVYLYNGNAGAYAPVALANAPVTITWFNTSSSAWSTIATTSSVTGQYSVDIMNYTDGAVVFCNATAPAPYGNAGYNYSTINFVTGGVQQNIVCGVPYDVEIIAPTPLTGTVSIAFNVVYRIVDRNGVLCQGYYTFADGPINMRDMGVATFVAPANYVFNGIASATPGTRTDPFTYTSPGLNTFNVSEGGVAELNPYLTPWGAWNMYSGAPGYLKDWDLWTINILGGGFNWHLEDGWNLVSVPADPISKGTNAVFDSFDALALCFAVSGDLTLSAAQRNLGTTPSTYVNFDYGMPEAGSFAMGSIYGYWIYTTTALPYDVNVLALNYSAGSNVVNVVAGWNLLGFTHNMGVTGGTGWGWVGAPTASDFTDGTITAGLNVPAVTKIVATWWNANSQWYNSYVVSTTFPGMAAHDWTYDTNYAYGYWVWSAAAVVVTFNVNY